MTSAELRDSDGDMEQPVAWDSGPNVETVSAVKVHGDEAVRLVRRGARSVMGNVRVVGPTCQKSFYGPFSLQKIGEKLL